ncbi:MAG: YidC/Oxa1 family membrane protein insertase [Lachnospirales bacterium]
MLNLLAVSRDVMKDPGVIVGPIAWVLGHVINFFFNIIYSLGIHNNSLGISIILLTIFTRCLLVPLSYKQQKSMFKMQALSPELKKIQEKYKDNKTDPEIQRKIQMETQKLYRENNVSPFSGCLPMIIQLPIFLGLYHVMQNPFKYIDVINDVYTQLSTIVLTAAQSNSTVADLVSTFANLGKITSGGVDVNIFNRIINILGPNEVGQLKTAIASADFDSVCAAKNSIEYFIGLNLTETVGYALTPKLIIPFLSGLTTFLSSWLMTRRNNNSQMDPAMKSQQRIMNVTMPLMMAWITISLPGGIGVYWIVSNLFQLCQQFFLNKHFEKTGAADVIVPKEKKSKKGGRK